MSKLFTTRCHTPKQYCGSSDAIVADRDGMLNKVLVWLLSRECALQYFTALHRAQSNGAKHQINLFESDLVQIVDGRHWQLSPARHILLSQAMLIH